MTSARVPVTIITGALGAGKSTLMKHILREKHGYRIAVIENEFADSMGIESLILKDDVEGSVADGFFELPNGCLCCSMKDSLVLTLQRLMEVREKFDYILVETSGLADPGPVAGIFWSDLGDDATMMLDGIITLIDARNFEADLGRSRTDGAVNEVERQVACSDVLLVNKVDLVSSQELDSLQTTLVSMNRLATIHCCCKSVIALDKILDLHQFAGNSPPAIPGPSDEVSPHAHHHDVTVSSAILSVPVADVARVERYLGTLLWDNAVVIETRVHPIACTVLRIKGLILCGASGDVVRPTLVQAVHQLFELSELPAAPADAEYRVCLIGSGVAANRELLQAGLNACAFGEPGAAPPH
jgi:G3E family GTPase